MEWVLNSFLVKICEPEVVLQGFRQTHFFYIQTPDGLQELALNLLKNPKHVVNSSFGEIIFDPGNGELLGFFSLLARAVPLLPPASIGIAESPGLFSLLFCVEPYTPVIAFSSSHHPGCSELRSPCASIAPTCPRCPCPCLCPCSCPCWCHFSCSPRHISCHNTVASTRASSLLRDAAGRADRPRVDVRGPWGRVRRAASKVGHPRRAVARAFPDGRVARRVEQA